MKVRNDFVTNSSSSSFIIAKKELDSDQISAIHNHIKLAAKIGLTADEAWHSEWNIRENDYFITGYTDMDNFSMCEFLSAINVSDKSITWGEHQFNFRDFSKPSSSKRSEWRSKLREIGG